MNAGIEIINDFGTVLIDAGFENLSLFSKGEATVLAAAGGAGYVDISASIANGQMPIIAIRSSFYATVAYTSASSTVFTARIVSEQLSVGQQLSYYVFSIPINVPDAKGLLQVRNSENKLIFDSNLDYFRCIGFYPNSASWSDFLIPPGKTVAYVPTQPGLRSLSRNENPTPPPFRYVVTDDYVGYRVSGGRIQRNRFITQIQQRTSNSALPDWAASYASPESGLLIADVTGY